jgi:hypothetical protein
MCKPPSFYFTSKEEKLHCSHRSNTKILLLLDVPVGEFRCKNLKSMAL